MSFSRSIPATQNPNFHSSNSTIYFWKAQRLNMRPLLVLVFFKETWDQKGKFDVTHTAISPGISRHTHCCTGSAFALSGRSASITQIAPHTSALLLPVLTVVAAWLSFSLTSHSSSFTNLALRKRLAQLPWEKLISKENEAENQREMPESALSAVRLC